MKRKFIIDFFGCNLCVTNTKDYDEDGEYYKFCEHFGLVSDNEKKLKDYLLNANEYVLGLQHAYDFLGDY